MYTHAEIIKVSDDAVQYTSRHHWGSSYGTVLEKKIHTHLGLMRPSVGNHVAAKQLEQKRHHD